MSKQLIRPSCVVKQDENNVQNRCTVKYVAVVLYVFRITAKYQSAIDTGALSASIIAGLV